jgi:hypothetical protein
LSEIKLLCNKKNKENKNKDYVSKGKEINLINFKINKLNKLWEKWKDKEWEWQNKYLCKKYNKEEQLDNIDK